MPLFEIEVDGRPMEVFGFELSEQAKAYRERANAATAEAETARADAEAARAETGILRSQVDIARAEGKAEGRAEAEAECALKHFVTSAVGDGTNYIEFDAPDFQPDAVMIYAADPAAIAQIKNHSVLLMCFTPNGNGTYGMAGVAQYINGETVQASRLLGAATGISGYYMIENGKAKVGKRANDETSEGIKLGSSGSTTAKFLADQTYVLAAFKNP